MRFIHLSDLHLGKRVNNYPMIGDQTYILEQILDTIKKEKPDAVLIAGDVYDKPSPSAEAVRLFDDFISSLADLKTEVFIISGNHDSAERLTFGSRIMDRKGIHFAGGYDGKIHMFSLEDEYGRVNFYMLPFLKPLHVRAFIESEGSQETEAADIRTYTDAVAFAVNRMNADQSERNILIAHQFVTAAIRSDSEEISVGGLDNVDGSVFEPFDYTALGHLHIPQNVNDKRIRYSGSPLKYSFSEAGHDKSLTIVDLGAKHEGLCDIQIEYPVLVPMHDMVELKGSFYELTDKNYYENINRDDYFRIILTDEEDVIGALASLRTIYPNIMRLEYENTRTKAVSQMPDAVDNDGRSPLEIFAGLYEIQNGRPMSDEQTHLISGLIEKVWGDNK